MTQVLVSRAEAKAAGHVWFFTGRPCGRGHVSERYVKSKICVDCAKIAERTRRETNRERIAEYKRNYYDANKEGFAERSWGRRRREKDATPPWLTEADRAAIAALYREAWRLTHETGVRHEVDHIVPLRGRLVSGLHVPGNLRVISMTLNRRKSNKWRADDLGLSQITLLPIEPTATIAA